MGGSRKASLKKGLSGGGRALPAAIQRLRDQAWRRRRELRLRTPAQARAFVRKVGFCLFWPTHGVDLPNLLQAIAGNGRPLTTGYDDPAIGRSWNWKDQALDKRWWYYGKLIRRRATLVSLDLLPSFYALSENYGDPNDYLIEYREGRLSAEAKSVFEALLTQGPLDAVRLRSEARLASSSAKSRFDRALAELQAGLKVLPVGVAEAGAWKYAFVYELVERWFPDLPNQARDLATSEARWRIVRQLLANLMAADRGSLLRSLGWKPAELERALGPRLSSGEVVELEGAAGRPWLALKPLAGRIAKSLGSPGSARSPLPPGRGKTASRPSKNGRAVR